MRTFPPTALALALCACHTGQSASVSQTEFQRRGAFVDAVALAAPSEAKNGAASDAPTVIGVDPVVAQVIRAAIGVHDHRRRVALANLANVDTNAYKRLVVHTSVQNVTTADGQTFAIPVVVDTLPVETTGVLAITDRNLDVAIDGEGFFAVSLADNSVGYTRDGAFQLDSNGRLVTGDGDVVLPQITVPNDVLEISIDPTGRVSGRTASSPDTSTPFGQLTIHRFINAGALRGIGHGVLCQTPASRAPISAVPGSFGLGTLKQGFLERSNVQSNQELMELQVLERQHASLVAVLKQFGMLAP